MVVSSSKSFGLDIYSGPPGCKLAVGESDNSIGINIMTTELSDRLDAIDVDVSVVSTLILDGIKTACVVGAGLLYC